MEPLGEAACWRKCHWGWALRVTDRPYFLFTLFPTCG